MNPQTTPLPFVGFPKIARLSRDCIITEKIDGTNAQILITEDEDILVGSRNRWITPQNDNFGFATWVEGNRSDILKLGPGRHFGEWWGQGIQRRYGMSEKRLSLFNVSRWCQHNEDTEGRTPLPEGIYTVPTLYEGPFDLGEADKALQFLKECGSGAARGFMNPEGIIVYHVAGNVSFKKTLEGDDHKGQ